MTPPAAENPSIHVRQSPVHGLGVFATRAIPAGAPIARYAGRRYTAEEVGERDWDAALTYVFGLSDGSVIDGAEGGNATRHLNHSCAPNCIAWEVEDEDGMLHIEIEALHAIGPGEELTLDYGLVVDDDGDDEAFRCGCGTPRCRGTMAAAGTA